MSLTRSSSKNHAESGKHAECKTALGSSGEGNNEFWPHCTLCATHRLTLQILTSSAGTYDLFSTLSSEKHYYYDRMFCPIDLTVPFTCYCWTPASIRTLPLYIRASCMFLDGAQIPGFLLTYGVFQTLPLVPNSFPTSANLMRQDAK